MGEQFHTPVLVDAVCDALLPSLGGRHGANVLVDATTGGGGHAMALLERARPRVAVLMDRDPQALAHASLRLSAYANLISFVHARFSSIREVVLERGLTHVHAILADLGVSSHQVDNAVRGFSFRSEAPLDMRMDPSTGYTAAEFLALVDVPTLANVLHEYGEERRARAIARAIVRDRPTTTTQLASIVVDTIGPPRPGHIHPATRTFQAIRIHVNQELEQLDTFLDAAPELLAPGGRLCIIAFHSLEDRRVKHRIHALTRIEQPPPRLPIVARTLAKPKFRIPPGYTRGITPSADELDRNPRARSARLRLVERCAS